MSLMGHSMGGELTFISGQLCIDCLFNAGHGALSLYLKNPGTYKSASAFSPAW